MRWILDPTIRTDPAAAAGLTWVRAFLARFSTGDVESVRIDRGNPGGRTWAGRVPAGVYGRCYYPTGRGRARRGFRLSCQVPGPFPYTVRTWERPLYFDLTKGEFHPEEPPPGCEFGGVGHTFTNGVMARCWVQVIRPVTLATLSEAIVWILGHEAFHFLRRARQVEGRNTEHEADRWANAQLAAFREVQDVR